MASLGHSKEGKLVKRHPDKNLSFECAGRWLGRDWFGMHFFKSVRLRAFIVKP